MFLNLIQKIIISIKDKLFIRKKLYSASFKLSNLITVANIDSQGRLDKTSNYGPNSVDLTAPGTNEEKIK